MRILSDVTHVAKKNHPCDACRQRNRSNCVKKDMSADDWLIVEAAKADNWKILRGQVYRKAVFVHEGELVTYRARLGMDALCLKNELFDK